MFAFAAPRPARRPSLTPMIDIVFLLLVFFMLASQFGVERVVPLAMGGGGAAYSGLPRLVTVSAHDVRLNGQVVARDALADRIAPLMGNPEDVIVLQTREGAALQDLMDVAAPLAAAGYKTITVVE